MTRRRFPRSFAWLLRVLLPRAIAAETLDDLRDAFEHRRASYRWLLSHVARAPAAALRYHLSTRRDPHRARRPLARSTHATRLLMGRTADRFLRDLRYVVRAIVKAPIPAAIIILTLALGVGANTAIFTVVDRVLLEELPYADAGQLVLLRQRRPNGDSDAVPPPTVRAWREGNETLVDLAYTRPQEQLNFVYEGSAERITAKRVSINLFRVLGITPFLGRAFAPGEDTEATSNVVVLSHGFWQRRFAGDSSVISSTIRLDANTYTVIGVMPPDFTFTFPRHRSQDVWIPRVWTEQWRDAFGWSSEHVLGRRKPGVTVDQVTNDLLRIQAGLIEQHGSDMVMRVVEAVDLRDHLTGELRPTLWMIFSVVSFVLLVACVNVVNLTVARYTRRQRELAVRSALGGARGDLLRPLLLESLVLGVIGGGAGLVVGAGALTLLLRLAPPEMPRLGEIRIDLTAFAFALGVAVIAGVGAGALAAWRSTRLATAAALRPGSTRAVGDRREGRLRQALVASEACLVVLLLGGTGLMLRSLWKAHEVHPGMDIQHTVAVKVVLPLSAYPTVADIGSFFDAVVDGVRALPGVLAAGVTTGLPMGGSSITITAPPPEDVAMPDSTLRTIWAAVTPDYFEAAGIPLLAGRRFDANDTPDRKAVVIVNQSFAATMWPDLDPIGRRVLHGQMPYRVVGVVGNTRYRGLEKEEGLVEYMPHRQSTFPWPEVDLLVRTAGIPLETIAPAIRRIVRAVDPEQAIAAIRTLDEVVATSLDERRFHVALMASFAAVGLLLGIIGVYGVVSYGVSQRTTEMGIRLALGSTRRHVLGLVAKGALTPVALGVVFGLTIAAAAGHAMERFLFQVTAADPLTLTAVAVSVLAAGALASYLPARRATRVDPITALRAD